MPTSLGAAAPDFVLRGWQGTSAHDYRLAQERGHPVLLVFYRGDERLHCARALRAYSDRLADVSERGAVLWCVGAQDLHSHREFARRHDLQVPLLADTAGVVAGMYGVLGPSHVRRAVFVLDAAGRIRWRWVSRWNLGFPRVERLLTVLDGVRLPTP